MSQLFVYVTAGDREEAIMLGREAVKARLAACANVLGPSLSVYWWDGAVQTDEEAVVILKSTEDKIGALTDLIRDKHSYDCPCVVALPIKGGNEEFLTWIESETA